MSTFGRELERLADTADSLRWEQLQNIYQMTRKYAEQQLNIKKVELLEEKEVEYSPGLEPRLDERDRYGGYKLKRDDGTPRGLNAQSFLERRPLWVTTTAEQPQATLSTPGHAVDLWSDSSVAEQFEVMERHRRGGTAQHTRTVISIPLHHRGYYNYWGVLYFESDKRLVPTDRARVELERIAKSLGWLYQLYVHERTRRNRTDAAISAVSDNLGAYQFHFPYEEPLVFGIYSERVDRRLLSIVAEEVQRTAVFRWERWEDLTADGIVNQQVESRLRQAQLLVAILSEPVDQRTGDGSAFRDNPNVLYELGIFRAMMAVPTEPPDRAILIREEDSGRAPFDIAHFRRIEVPRGVDGILYDEFQESFVQHLQALGGG